ncbi:hypothetical protein [Thaumasiovibrio subtropicus]|uniref:hypothetical protein n=1 Tax=Thaumasiovibrio subtropicus TaxID=1891207 RepID=UPI000B35A7B8|nr:hypothetical protein [Thaumasiovibrio subtropicus]
MKKTLYAFMLASILTGCATTQDKYQEQVTSNITKAEIAEAIDAVTSPLFAQLEEGTLEITFVGPELELDKLAMWERELADLYLMNVDIRWSLEARPDFDMITQVHLHADTCKFDGVFTSEAQCRRAQNRYVSMVNKAHFNNGLALKLRSSELEVGAVQRLLQGRTRIAEDPTAIVENNGGGSGD